MSDEKKHSLNLKSWASICKPKSKFELMEQPNQGLITKMGWLIQSGSEKLWVQALKAKYMRNPQSWENPPPQMLLGSGKGFINQFFYSREVFDFRVTVENR